MAYTDKVVLVGSDWTLITDKLALIQFNDEMEMYVNEGDTPTATTGFLMEVNEKYINSMAGVCVWAKSKQGGTNVESVRVVEDV